MNENIKIVTLEMLEAVERMALAASGWFATTRTSSKPGGTASTRSYNGLRVLDMSYKRK